MTVQVELDSSGERILISSEWRYKDLIKTIPGANWRSKEEVWSMPISWAGCLALRGTFGNDLEIGPKLTEWANEELTKRVSPSNALREQLEAVGDLDLFPHQRAGVQFLATAKQALLADEAGTGKTATTIRALAEIVRRGDNPFPVLVVAPNTVKTNWKREFEKWWPEVPVQVIHGSAVQRRKQFETYLHPVDGAQKPAVFIINWESLRAHSRLAPYGGVALTKCVEHGGEDEKISANRCEVHLRELNEIKFGAVIADEVHRAKEAKSKQTRALWAATGDAEYRFALSGTPIAQNVADMWTILHWLSPDEWPSRSRFIDRMVDTVINAFGGIHILGLKPQTRDEFFAGVNPRLRRTLKKIVLPFLPPILHEEREVEMGTVQKKAYEQMRDKMIAELESGEIVTATSPLVQMTRLLQFSVAHAESFIDESTGEEHIVLSDPSATIDAFLDDIKSGDFDGESVAVSAGGPGAKQLLNLLSARLTKEGIRHGMITGDVSPDVRQKSIDEFQDGQIKFILYTTQAGGVGITLTAASRLIRLLLPWSFVEFSQSNDRVYRIGSEQHSSIMITDYVVRGTVQQRVKDVLEDKENNSDEIMNDRATILRILHEDAPVKKPTRVKKAKKEEVEDDGTLSGLEL